MSLADSGTQQSPISYDQGTRVVILLAAGAQPWPWVFSEEEGTWCSLRPKIRALSRERENQGMGTNTLKS